MTTFQLIMLGASAFFAFKVYEHIQTLQDPEPNKGDASNDEQKSADTFSPFDPKALIEKADTAFEEGDMQKALALLTEANAKEKQNSDVLFKIGYILQQLGDNSEALNYYKEALETDKNNEYIHNSMASVYRANGEFVSAKMHLTESLEINNENPVTYYNYGNLLVDMQHPDEAKEMYKKALEINPDFDEAKEEFDKLS
ncbi:tetratricopeptide repeat protein [Sulfurimonas sp.]|uniref:tetratricopeptide repeat protein n=1 Tax=Sulfurimonas sp. TaxID=2022749 RepID=UPI0026294697|nr:tetratricopeptide repeat protein [Sulfurimonas sp.]MCW8896362.1 tetratricopeptide repeat protein [Sulfurimonas sp.]